MPMTPVTVTRTARPTIPVTATTSGTGKEPSTTVPTSAPAAATRAHLAAARAARAALSAAAVASIAALAALLATFLPPEGLPWGADSPDEGGGTGGDGSPSADGGDGSTDGQLRDSSSDQEERCGSPEFGSDLCAALPTEEPSDTATDLRAKLTNATEETPLPELGFLADADERLRAGLTDDATDLRRGAGDGPTGSTEELLQTHRRSP